MNRRRFLTRAATLAAGAGLAPAVAAESGGGEFIDTNVTLGDWPLRPSPYGQPGPLAAKLRSHGVTSAWTSSWEGVLQSDIGGVNDRLARACRREGGGVLVAFGAINPTLPDWEEDLRRCHETHRMPGVRLWPNYHGYALDDPRFVRLLELSAQRRLLVQIALTIEDDRSQNPALTAAPVLPAPLVELVAARPQARVMLLNAARLLAPAHPVLRRLAQAGVGCELATLEGAAGIERLLAALPGLRLAFGSHAPLQYFEAAQLKLDESELTAAQLQAIRAGFARAALASRP